MRVFIDAMIYIKYFSAALVQSKILQKIDQLIDEGEITLVFPEITYDEVYRNSIEEISDYKKKISSASLIKNLPPSVLDSKTYSDAQGLIEQLNEKIVQLRKEYQDSMDKLMEIVESIKRKAEKLPEPEELIEKAHRRRLLGKLPYPTKPVDGLGDGIAWEMLLAINDKKKTIIVTEDWGWKNEKDGNQNALHPSMQKEWKKGARGEIKLYNSLSEFLKTELPQVKLSKKDIDLDKKASQINTSIYPMIYPVTYGGTSNTWDDSMMLGGPAVLGTEGAHVSSPDLYGLDRSIYCVHCRLRFERPDNFPMGAALMINRCPHCGEQN